MKHLAFLGRVLLGVAIFTLPQGCEPTPGSAPGLDPSSPPTAARPLPYSLLRATQSLYGDVRVETLPNGLKVFLKPIPGSPVVTTMVAYRVGSADEELDHTGLSHYLEHLMFKGTDKLKPGDIDRLTLKNGGANNAYTDYDMTVFHFDFVADRWEKALEVEADRMCNLRIDAAHEFEQEKGAVIEELRRDEDEPWDLESKALLPLLFGEGPYGHPILGQTPHVRGATTQVIKGHYDRWYHPNNACLVIAGGFDPDAALARIKELFGPIPAADLPPRRSAPPAPARAGPVEKEIPSKFSVARMIVGFNTVRIGEPDDPVLDVTAQLLAGGKTGRLYRRLVEQEQVANNVSAGNMAGRYPGFFQINVELLPDKDRAAAQKIVLDELARLANEPIQEEELERARRSIIAGQIFSQENVHDLADAIARTVADADLPYLRDYIPHVAAVTGAQVQAAARRYLDPQRRVVVWSVPLSGGPGGTGESGESGGSDKSGGGGTATAPAGHPGRGVGRDMAAPRQAAPSLANAQKVVLNNGLTLWLLESHRLPIVVAAAQVRDVALHEPAEKAGVAELTGRLLDEGTARRTGPEIAEAIEAVGGSLDMSSGGGSVQVLAPDRELGLSLLLECLSQPSFPTAEFERERERLLSDLDDAQQQPDTRAQHEYLALVYGAHPLGRPREGFRKTVEALKPDDCAAFHRSLFVPNNTTLAIVGDFEAREVIEQVTQLTADWRPGPIDKLALPAVALPGAAVRKIVTLPEAQQLHFFMGHPGIRRDNPDFYKLLVMDYILGTGPGFTDRLTARLRDREGLAYTVSANITASAGTEPGLFTCYVGTSPENFARVEREFREEITRFRAAAPTEAEVADAKAYLTGSLPFRLTTSGGIAALLLQIDHFKLGLTYLNDYRRNVAAVSAQDVWKAARKYLDPDRMVVVAAGAVDAQGRPLESPTTAPASGTATAPTPTP